MTAEHRVAVAVDVPQHSGLVDLLDYASDGPLAPGTLVRVPLGKRDVPGLVWRGESSGSDAVADVPPAPLSATPDSGGVAGSPPSALGPGASTGNLDPTDAAASPRALKPVREVLDAIPPLPAPWLDLVGFAARYYQRSLGEMALAVLPPELRTLDAAKLARRVAQLQKRYAAETPATATPGEPRQHRVLLGAGPWRFNRRGVGGSFRGVALLQLRDAAGELGGIERT